MVSSYAIGVGITPELLD